MSRSVLPASPPVPLDEPQAHAVLDAAVWQSLAGPHHAHLAQGDDLVRRYRADVSPFLAVRDVKDPRTWDALVALVGPGVAVPLVVDPADVPAGWEVGETVSGVQLVATGRLKTAPCTEAVELGEADVEEMLALVGRTRPGPFLSGTHLMGTYLGVRRQGRLVAMAGERLRPPGYTEISAVCTDPAFRGQGLAGSLVLAVAHEIRARGETPFLHAAASNTGAVALYERLGFELRQRNRFVLVRTPQA